MSMVLLAASIGCIAVCLHSAKRHPESSFAWTVGAALFTVIAVGFMFA
jgi:hypothetical protein